MKNIIKKSKGYSLTELMISIAIMAILATMAAPSMQNYMARQQMRTLAQELVDAMMLARSEALANGIEYKVTPIDGDWNNGWETWDTQDVASSAEVLFKRYDVTNALLPLSMTMGALGDNMISFDGNGRANTLTRFELDYTRAYDGFKPYCITVAGSGNIDVIVENCDDL